MSKFKIPYYRWCLHLFTLSVLVNPSLLQAQQNEIPPASETEANAAGRVETRIVDGRPTLYRVKRALHPVAWLDAGLRPVFRVVDNIKFDVNGEDDEEKTPKTSGVKLGIRGMGSSSGIGPEIKPFHKDLFGAGIELEVPLLVTYKMYQSAGARLNFPIINGTSNRLGFEVLGRYTSRASDRFFGIGNESNAVNESRFRSVSRVAGVALEARLANRSWIVRAETDFKSIGITRPRNFTSVADVFGEAGAIGLSEPGATMIVSSASLERNTKDREHLPSSGGMQRVEASLNEGRTGGDYSFWRYRAEAQQFIPLTDDKRSVIGIRGAIETNKPKGGSVVPFWEMPILGSHSTLRGFQSRRFTDRSAVNASIEYRYRIWRYFDWGLFADAGQVAPEIRDFTGKDFHKGYGMRFIVRAGSEAVGIAAAHSREAWMFYVDFSPNF